MHCNAAAGGWACWALVSNPGVWACLLHPLTSSTTACLKLLRPSLPTRVPACCPAGPVYNCQRPVAARAGQDRSEVLGTQPNSPAAAAGQRRSAPPAAGSRTMSFPAVPINWDAPASFYTGSDELAELAGGLASICDAFEKSSSLHASVLPQPVPAPQVLSSSKPCPVQMCASSTAACCCQCTAKCWPPNRQCCAHCSALFTRAKAPLAAEP